MKLYFSPGACSLSPHITLRELDLPFELERVDNKAKRTASGADFLAINPKAYVPVLELDDGSTLTEGPAIVQYLADLRPERALAPPNGSMARYRLQEWLGFINSEIHKAHGPIFHPGHSDAEKQAARELIARHYDYVARQLEGKTFLLDETFTVADAYLYTVMTWARYAGVSLERWPGLQAYFERVRARPSVKAAHEAEKAAVAGRA